MSEEILIQRLKDGDESAFWEFQSKYCKDIYRAARFVVKSREDALDVCQNVLLKVWLRIDQYEPHPGKSLWTWLRTITKHEALNFLRGERRRPNLVHRDDEFGDEMDNIPHPESCPSTEAEKNELGAIIIEIMNIRLTPRERLFFQLKHKEGLTYKEIAGRENCAVGTAKATVASAVQKMVNGLGQRGIKPEDYR